MDKPEDLGESGRVAWQAFLDMRRSKDEHFAYLEALEENGHVLADFDERRKMVVSGVKDAAKKAGGTAVADDDLYDEVTALVEWPVPIVGSFDDEYLDLPRECVVSL